MCFYTEICVPHQWKDLTDAERQGIRLILQDSKEEEPQKKEEK